MTEDQTMIAYRMWREHSGVWMYAGTTPQEAANVLKAELDSDEGLPLDEREKLEIEPFEISQEEIDAMPDFPGW